MATKAMSAMSTDSSIAGTERLLAQGADGSVILVSAISAYTIADLIASTAATPTTGDYLLGFRGTDEKTMTLDLVATYAVNWAWSNASTVTPAVTGDLLLVSRSGTVYDMNVDTLVTYALTTTAAAGTPLQAGALNTSGLGSATLSVSGTTDLFNLCQTGAPTVPKTLTLAAMETRLWTDYGVYVAALTAIADGAAADSNTFYVLEGSTAKKITATVLATYMSAEIIALGTIQASVLDTLDTYLAALAAVTTPANTDLLYCTQGGTAKKLALLDLANFAVANAFELPWTEVSTSKWTTTPASTSTITMSDTSDFAIGLPVKWVVGGLTYYGIVTAVSANALLTIAGATLGVAALTSLWVGMPSGVTTLDLVVDDAYGATVQDIFKALTYERHRWGKSPAYLVQFSATHGVIDTGAAQPKLNVRIGAVNDSGGDLVSTEDTNKGIQLSATAGTWVTNSAIELSTSYYRIIRGEEIDLRCTVIGTNGDADLLSVTLIFVSE